LYVLLPTVLVTLVVLFAAFLKGVLLVNVAPALFQGVLVLLSCALSVAVLLISCVFWPELQGFRRRGDGVHVF
jgi:hypothetical protein